MTLTESTGMPAAALGAAGDDATVVREYLYDVHYRSYEIIAEGQGELDHPDRPPVFTRPATPRARTALPPRPPVRLGPLADTLAGRTEPAAGCDQHRLGALLYYGFGLSRLDLGPLVEWPWHRTVASARCFYPVELHVWSPAVPPGIHRYDAAHHELWRQRGDTDQHALGEVAAADLSGAVAVVVVTARLGKTAFRYRNYAYRLVCQEAGLVAGNLLLVAEALGLRGQLRFQFRDRSLASWLGLPDDDSEAVLALLPFWLAGQAPATADIRPAGVQPAGARPAGELPRTAPVKLAGGTGLDRPLCARTLAVERASRLPESSDLTLAMAPLGGSDQDDDGTTPAGEGRPQTRSLARWRAEGGTAGAADTATAIVRRDSGPEVFLPVPVPLPRSVLAGILTDAAPALPTDLWRASAPRQVGLHAIVGRVSGVEPGHYRVTGDALQLVRAGDLGAELQSMSVWPTAWPPVINTSAAPLVVIVTGYVAALLGCHPRRAFRAMQIQTGVVAQRVSVAAAAHGLSARVTNSYGAGELAEALALDPEQEVPTFLLVIGRARPGRHFVTRIRP